MVLGKWKLYWHDNRLVFNNTSYVKTPDMSNTSVSVNNQYYRTPVHLLESTLPIVTYSNTPNGEHLFLLKYAECLEICPVRANTFSKLISIIISAYYISLSIFHMYIENDRHDDMIFIYTQTIYFNIYRF